MYSAKKLMNDFSFMSYAPIIFISAKTGQRVDRLFELIKFVDSQNAMRVTTGMLNDLLARATARVQPPSDKGKRLKIYYMTQIATRPPTFVCFCNSKQLFHFFLRALYRESDPRDLRPGGDARAHRYPRARGKGVAARTGPEERAARHAGTKAAGGVPGAEYRRDYRCCKPCCAARHVLPPRICLAL